MDALDAWNTLSWMDGTIFSVWIGAMYYAKSWIDSSFHREKYLLENKPE
jgi:hypothetical protein